MYKQGSQRRTTLSGRPAWDLDIGLSTCPKKCSKIVYVVPYLDRFFDCTYKTGNGDVICSLECWNFIENSSKGIRTVFLKFN